MRLSYLLRQAFTESEIPRNRVPWIVIGVAWAISGTILLLIRWYLARENTRRDAQEHNEIYDDIYVYAVEKSRRKSTRYVSELIKVHSVLLSLTELTVSRRSSTLQTFKTRTSDMLFDSDDGQRIYVEDRQGTVLTNFCTSSV